MIATVFRYGTRRESAQEVVLPAYVSESYLSLVNDREVCTTSTHQLSAGESYGVGSSGSYSVYPGYPG